MIGRILSVVKNITGQMGEICPIQLASLAGGRKVGRIATDNPIFGLQLPAAEYRSHPSASAADQYRTAGRTQHVVNGAAQQSLAHW